MQNKLQDDIEERLAHVEELSKIKVLRSCEELARHGVSKNGIYEVDPDGELVGYDPISVYCTFDNGIAITEVKHSYEKVIDVEKCEGIGCFKQDIDYMIPLSQIEALTSISESCDQSISFGCFLAPLLSNGDELGGWLDRYGKDKGIC